MRSFCCKVWLVLCVTLGFTAGTSSMAAELPKRGSAEFAAGEKVAPALVAKLAAAKDFDAADVTIRELEKIGEPAARALYAEISKQGEGEKRDMLIAAVGRLDFDQDDITRAPKELHALFGSTAKMTEGGVKEALDESLAAIMAAEEMAAKIGKRFRVKIEKPGESRIFNGKVHVGPPVVEWIDITPADLDKKLKQAVDQKLEQFWRGQKQAIAIMVCSRSLLLRAYGLESAEVKEFDARMLAVWKSYNAGLERPALKADNR